MSPCDGDRVTTTLEGDCEVCGNLWEFEAYADYQAYNLVPDPIDPEDAECPDCGTWICPRKGTGIGEAILAQFERLNKELEGK